MSQEKKFVGSCKTVETQYGNLISIGLKEEDLKMLLEHLNGGWVNLTLKTSQASGKPYLELNQFTAKSGASKEKSEDASVRKTKDDVQKQIEKDCNDDLPF